MPILRSNRPVIAITMGDPSGIGPEVTVKALASMRHSMLANFFVIGDRYVLERVKKKLGLKIDIPLISLDNVPRQNFSYGKASPVSGKAAIEYIDTALELLKMKKRIALVTAPVNKLSINMAGFPDFSGHTEYLAEHTGTKDFAMMFVGEKLKVTLVTRHIAVKDVPGALSRGLVAKTILLTHRYLKDSFGIRRPKIGVAGLNPHSGEGGILGNEERRFIIPAIKDVSRRIKSVAGPIAADVLFHEALKGKFDAAVSMYHDQGLPPFKMLYFKSGVNMTLGLPFIRTSPDHGTGFDIAGKGIADPASMIEAIKLACRLSK